MHTPLFRSSATGRRWTLTGILIAVILAHLSTGRAQAPAATPSPGDGTRVVLLGTGTPNADPDRWGPATAVVVGETAYLVDCGPGVVRRAAAAYRKGIKALAPKNLRWVFITHLHSDHTLGYPDLVLSPWVLERDQPLEAYGPKGLENMTRHILEAFSEDIRIRVEGLEPANTEGYKVNVHEIAPGVVYRDGNLTVRAFAVKHGSWAQAFGYRFETPDRTIVISGDTTPTQAIAENCDGCDLLVHEVYSWAGFQKRSPLWQKYHASFHTSTLELAEIAKQARPGLLILTHQLFWGSTEDELLQEIRRHYHGRVVSGRDLDVY